MLYVFSQPGVRLRTYTLLTEEYKCVMRKDHPLVNEQLTLEKFAQAKHLLISLTGEATDFIDELLEEKGLKRRIGLTIIQFALAPVCIANSDLIGTLTSRTVKNWVGKDQLYMTDLPIELEAKIIKIMWHERNQHNPSHIWLSELFIQVCEKI